MTPAVKVLIVDDSISVQEMMQEMLKRSGLHDLTVAGNGQQALSLFREALLEGKPYGLVLLDIVMPKMDGQQALKRMRAMEKEAGTGTKALIIMVTSLSSTYDMMEAIVEGDCTDYLVKPFEPEHLQYMLAKYGLFEIPDRG
jgi:two-component system chemotaxis response regulator CheY